MDFETRQNLPIMMVITAPIIVRRPRGKRAQEIHSRFHAKLKILLETEEKELIQAEAAALGITMAEFIRHCALQSARFLRKYRENYELQEHEVHDTTTASHV